MKRLVVALMLAAIVPAHADTDEQLDVWREITFTAPIPCSLACPYWLDTLNADVDGDGREDVFFSACTNPGGTGDELEGVGGVPYEEGTVYDDVLVGPRPDGARVLFVEIAPAVDWDMFICG